MNRWCSLSHTWGRASGGGSSRTPLFHFGGLHLAMNLYGHFALGRLVERMYGSVRFLVCTCSAPWRGVRGPAEPINRATAIVRALSDDWRDSPGLSCLNRRHLAATYMTAAGSGSGTRWFS